MVKTYSQLYHDARKQLLQLEEAHMATQLARLLVCHLSGKTREQFFLDELQYAPEEICNAVEVAVVRLLRNEPLAYVLGEWTFYGLNLNVNSSVLIPRDDTCALVDVAIKHGKWMDQDPRILDLCTGSGCIGLALASQIHSARVTLADISKDALAVAKSNVARLKLGGRVSCVQVDAFQPAPEFLGKFHMIVSNPPYITTEQMRQLDSSVKDFEPHLALHGGDDGLIFYRSIVEHFTQALRPGGYLAFEFGEEQGDDVCAILEAYGYTILDRVADFSGTERAMLARYDRKEE